MEIKGGNMKKMSKKEKKIKAIYKSLAKSDKQLCKDFMKLASETVK